MGLCRAHGDAANTLIGRFGATQGLSRVSGDTRVMAGDRIGYSGRVRSFAVRARRGWVASVLGVGVVAGVGRGGAVVIDRYPRCPRLDDRAAPLLRVACPAARVRPPSLSRRGSGEDRCPPVRQGRESGSRGLGGAGDCRVRIVGYAATVPRWPPSSAAAGAGDAEPGSLTGDCGHRHPTVVSLLAGNWSGGT